MYSDSVTLEIPCHKHCIQILHLHMQLHQLHQLVILSHSEELMVGSSLNSSEKLMVGSSEELNSSEKLMGSSEELIVGLVVEVLVIGVEAP